MIATPRYLLLVIASSKRLGSQNKLSVATISMGFTKSQESCGKTLMISKTNTVAIENLRIKYRIEPVGV